MGNSKRYNRIKAVLADTDKNNKQIASHLGIQEETVSRWMSNKAQPSIKRLFEIAEYLEVDVRSLLVSNQKPKS